jgi:tripartite-type tricarboxylate transporter receptor subunit TctC
MVRVEVPDEITNRLAEVVNKVLASPDGRDFARKVGSELLLRGPAEMRRYQVSQIETLRRVAEAAGMKPE